MSELVSFKCPSCGAPLRYDAEKQSFLCDYCGNTFDFDTVKNADVNADTPFDWGNYQANVSEEELDGTVSYICKSCGAEVVADATTAASFCPYCGSNIVMEHNVGGLIKPNGIIPFRIDKKRLGEIVANYCKDRPLLPKNFITEKKISEIQGVYVPFWLYNCHADGRMGFDATRVRTWSDTQFNYTETSYYYVLCEGDMDFDKVPADGSIRMDNALMDSIEPFDFTDLQPFAKGYLSGFVANRFDDDAEACLPRATERVQTSVSRAFRSAVSDYTTISESKRNIELQDTSVNYVLLPVYLISVKYNGQLYQYAVNGQTGKIVGELPIDKSRVTKRFLGVAAGVAAALLALLTFVF